MAKIKHVLRTAMASGIALALAVMPSAALAQDDVSEGVEALVESASEIAEEASQTLQTAREGYINVTVEDPMRAAISELAGNTDDMSWVKNAELLMQEVPNESGGADAEVTLLFNDTELYHLQLSYDAQAQNFLTRPWHFPSRQCRIPVPRSWIRYRPRSWRRSEPSWWNLVNSLRISRRRRFSRAR